MRLVLIDQCRPGMRLARKIYNDAGVVLLAERMELSQTTIRRLNDYGIAYVYVEDDRTDDIRIPELIAEETRRGALETIRTHFRDVLRAPDTSRRLVCPPYMSKAFMKTLTDIIDDLSQNPNAMIMLTDIQTADHYLYQHSLNVCIYTTMLGLSGGYSRDELATLGLGALLHDIGKMKIAPEILRKPGKLLESEYEEMKRHADLGYRMLKDEPNIPLLSAHCALQHHERLDGSGYPRGIGGAEIHDYAQWIGVVDSYDAMTSSRVYRKAMLPHQAMEVLYTGAGTLYDPGKVERFRDRVAIYPPGMAVTLSTGEAGVVVDVNNLFPQRPIVRILQDPDGQSIAAPYETDLSKQLSIVVTGIGAIEPLP